MKVDHMEHARSCDVTGGEEGKKKMFPRQGMVEVDDEQSIACDAISRLKQMRGDRAAEDLLMSCDVIGMSMRDETVRFGNPRIEP